MIFQPLVQLHRQHILQTGVVRQHLAFCESRDRLGVGQIELEVDVVAVGERSLRAVQNYP